MAAIQALPELLEFEQLQADLHLSQSGQAIDPLSRS
jgi:hypothetical protein